MDISRGRFPLAGFVKCSAAAEPLDRLAAWLCQPAHSHPVCSKQTFCKSPACISSFAARVCLVVVLCVRSCRWHPQTSSLSCAAARVRVCMHLEYRMSASDHAMKTCQHTHRGNSVSFADSGLARARPARMHARTGCLHARPGVTGAGDY